MKITRNIFLRMTGLSLFASAGRRWAMVIDQARCLREKGCRRCITACHAAHNVPSMPDPKHEVKWIWKEPIERVFPSIDSAEPTLVFCNHCDNPPCVRVCPARATWKRDDGIVMMDWHRCIGCRYCMAACPYGSRSFNWRDPRPFITKIEPSFPTRAKGVVEKCTFCPERLAAGRKPACVEACPAGALIFGDRRDVVPRGRALRRKPELGTGPEVHYLL